MDQGLQILVGGLLLFVGWQIARALRQGQWGTGRRAYRRREEPAEFWFHLLWAVLTAATFLWLIATPADSLAGSTPWRLTFLIFFGMPAAFWLVRSLQTGATGFGDLRFTRAEEPREFWLLILAHLAVVGLSVWAVAAAARTRPPDFLEEVEPVMAAVRAETAAGGAASFHGVRIDPGSRLVCGEVSVGGGPRWRFFGAGSGGHARATVESERLPNFERAYRRVCGGMPVPAGGPAE